MPYYPPISSADIPYEAPKGAKFGGATYLGGVAPATVHKGTISVWFAGTVNGPGNTIFYAVTTSGVSESNFIVIGDTGDGFLASHLRVGNDQREYRSTTQAAFDTYMDGEWHHLIYSWDHAADTYVLYVDDTPMTLYDTYSGTVTAPTVAADSFIMGAWSIFRSTLALSDLWLKTGTALDLSVAANRRKFLSARGLPVYLGPEGLAPGLGTPQAYLRGDATDFRFNDGTMGDLTQNGSNLTLPALKSPTHR